MKRAAAILLAATFALSACGTPASDKPAGEDPLTKDQARTRANKGDVSTDWCEVYDWYGDGICDEFCLEPDVDCGQECPDDSADDCGLGAGEGEACGGLAGLTCGDGLTCAYPEGTCGLADGAGTCVATPQACIDLWAPVCGCDGQTYSNDCYALAAGATVDFEGECESPQGATCGGIAGLTCAEGQVCSYPAGTCGLADGAGTCVDQPDGCPENYDPVCGCDGNTYSNDCFALAAGATVDHDGECDVPSGDVCGGFAGVTCPDDQVCQYPAGTCQVSDGQGTCVPAPEACIDLYDPVCGCDGQTYSNDCYALAAGATVDHAGECEKPDEVACGGFIGATCQDDEYCYFEPATFCDFADASGVCKPRPDACTLLIDEVCGCNGKTYSNECFAAEDGTSVATEGPCSQ